MNLSPHFADTELTASATATARRIVNHPDRAAYASLRLVCVQLERLRLEVGPIHINSGFRCPELDRAVGGSGHGQHTLGEAVDIYVDGMTSTQLAQAVKRLGLEVDQVIAYRETGHLHLSHRVYGPQRGQYLWCESKSKQDYRPWDPDTAPTTHDEGDHA